MSLPQNLLYTKEHEWAKEEGDTFTVGITDHAQAQLGDITYIELPKVGTKITKDQTFGVVESVKAASDLFAPISGEVTAVNPKLTEAPEQINQNPYSSWMIKIRPSQKSELKSLLNAKDYQNIIGE